EGVGKGAVVALRFGRSRARGVVVGADDAPPEGVAPVAVEAVLEEVAPQLVDLALWIADYYGSTPARALELVAPRLPRRRGERRPPPRGLEGEPAPSELTPEQAAAVRRVVAAVDAGGGRHLLYGPTGSGKTE